MLAIHGLRAGVLFVALLAGILAVQSVNADGGRKHQHRAERYSHYHLRDRAKPAAAAPRSTVAVADRPVLAPEATATVPGATPGASEAATVDQASTTAADEGVQEAATPTPEGAAEETASEDATPADTATPDGPAVEQATPTEETPIAGDPPAEEPDAAEPAAPGAQPVATEDAASEGQGTSEEPATTGAAPTPAPSPAVTEQPGAGEVAADDRVGQPAKHRRVHSNRFWIQQWNRQGALNLGAIGSEQENAQVAANSASVQQGCEDFCLNSAVISQENELDAVNVAAPSPLVSSDAAAGSSAQSNTQVAANEAWVSQVCLTWCVNYTFIYQGNVLTGANLAAANAAAEAAQQENTQLSANSAYVEQYCVTYCYNITIILQENIQLAVNAIEQLYSRDDESIEVDFEGDTASQTNTQVAVNDVQVLQGCAGVCWNSLIVMQGNVQDAVNFLSPAGKV